MQDKFLQQVSKYYIDKGVDFTKYTFVFPNRRSAMFMRKYLQQGIDKQAKAKRMPTFMPRMITITNFIQQYNESALASTTELIFILYKAYCKVASATDFVPDFDRFYFWAGIILRDFNDLDANLADASKLYKNLKDLKEIKANYLTDEQKEVIRYLWGEEAVPADTDDMWHDFGTKDENSATAKFLYLWQVMGQLYFEFRRQLDAQPVPLAYSGLQSRRAYEAIKNMSADDFGSNRIVFVGFSVLSSARTLIFKHLKHLGVAEFFWDIASPMICGENSVQSSASRFVLPLSQQFKMPEDFTLQPIDRLPEVEIVSVPSNTAQAKVASTILKEWIKETLEGEGLSKIDDQWLVDTAIVMADEHLLTPMLYALPSEIESVNVTMGVSYSSTSFAALMSSIISMHLRARKRGDKFYYFYQDVVEVLSHPHIALIYEDTANRLRTKILTEHIYNISIDDINDGYGELTYIFTQIDDDKDIRQVRRYIDMLVSTLQSKLEERMGNDGREYYELKVLEAYANETKALCDMLELHNVKMQERTFLQIIERALSLSETNFVGQPLKGLQIMDIRDTRALDFSRLILMSMNERVFPNRNYTPSFIPMSLRNGYGLPTQEHEESSTAYQFYRLLSRAEKVSLLYDSRTAGISSGEMSRYLSQLLHLEKGVNVRTRIAELGTKSDNVKEITVNKTPHVISRLREYRPGGRKKLSASALKTYISCPLKFYMQHVLGLYSDNDVLEYIDAASYGTVIHALVQDLYNDHGGQVINEYTLEKMKHDDLENRALNILNRVYYNDRYKRLTDIPGEGQIVSKIIARYVEYMFESEKRIVPFQFIGAEVGEHETHTWKINDDYTLNFTMSVDRIDSFRDPNDPTQPALRFIDYKTGSDVISASNLEQLFTDHKCGGMFQLLVYSYAYASEAFKGFKGRIKPMIYKLQSIPKDGIKDMTFSKKEINDYRDVEGFYERFEQLIDCIFEEENVHPFVQTPNVDGCKYCQFASMCSRYPDPKY